MGINAYIDINKLPEEGRNELQQFYDYLIYKYKNRKRRNPERKTKNFKDFLSSEIEVEHFEMLNREERNAR